MKKILLIIVLSFLSLTAFAKAPNLHVEQLFDGSYNSNESVSTNIYRNQQKYFRGFTVIDNRTLLNKVEQLFEQDLTKAESSFESISQGQRYRSMVIKNNGEEINVGLNYDGHNGCYLFINGSVEAFK